MKRAKQGKAVPKKDLATQDSKSPAEKAVAVFSSSRTADSFVNFAARLGYNNQGSQGCEGSTNLLSAGRYELNLISRNRLLLEAAYRGSWIVGQVINTKAKDMTRSGVVITTNEQAKEVPEVMTQLSRLQIMTAYRRTIQWGDLYGGAIGVYQIEGHNLETPLSIDSVKQDSFKGITVYDRWQLSPSLTELIESGPDLGLPEFYTIVSGTDMNDPSSVADGKPNSSGQVKVHHTRCFRMIGLELPFFQAITEQLWGESVLERMWDRLIAFDDATMNAAGLIHRANLRTVHIEGLRQIVSAGGAALEGLVAQFEMMRLAQSNEGLTLLDKEDEFSSTAYTFTGIPETVMQLLQQVSGAAEVPCVRLLGQTPAGLNSNADGDIRLYYDGINAKQEATMRNPMDTTLKILWRSLTGKAAPKDLGFKFVPLWQMTEKEKSEIAKEKTEAVITAHQEGLIDSETAMNELRQQSAETGLFTHITDEAIADADELEPPAPDDAEPAEEPGKKKKPTGDSAWHKIKRWLKG